MEGPAGLGEQGWYMHNDNTSSVSWADDRVLVVRTWFILIVSGACAVWFLVGQYKARRLRLRMPPGPPSWPIFGSLIQIATSKLPIQETLANLAKVYGPVMFFRLGSLPCVVITSAEAAELVLKDSNFSHRATQTLLYSVRELEFDNQGFMSHYDGQLKLIRKLCTTEILTTSRIAAFSKVRVEDVQSTLVNVARISQATQTVNIQEALGNQGLNMMTQMLLGQRFCNTNKQVDKVLQNFGESLAKLLHLASALYWGDLFPALRWLDFHGRPQQYKNHRVQMESVLRTIIEELRIKAVKVDRDNGNDSANFLEVLLSHQKEHNLSDTVIMGTVQDLLIGGAEAFGRIAEWAIVELIRKPKKLQRLQEEIDNVTGRSRRVEESDFANLPYLRACVRETLRLYPTLPLLLPRETEEATTLKGYYIPPKTVVFVNAWQIDRDPTYYENPHSFEPERFLSSNRTEVADYHFLPFGAGRRVCVGMKLGTTMAQITLASLVHAYDWAPPPGIDAMDIDTSPTLGMNLTPRFPIHLQAVPRLQPGVYDMS